MDLNRILTGNMKRVVAAIVAACALSACGHLPEFDFDKKQAATRGYEQKAKPRTAAKPAATSSRVALRGAQSAEAGSDISDAAPAPALARAGKLRALALDQLNRGEVEGAVANLKAARELDPSNELIQRDLERANRIRATVAATGAAQPK